MKTRIPKPLEPFLDALAELLVASVLRDIEEGKIKVSAEKTSTGIKNGRARRRATPKAKKVPRKRLRSSPQR